MTDYNELSDFEINKRVGKLTGLAKGNEPALQVVLTSTGSKFDPCNYPHQALPIMVGNRIGIIPAETESRWKAAHRKLGELNVEPQFFTVDDNPLRAAMIVFLKMNEGK